MRVPQTIVVINEGFLFKVFSEYGGLEDCVVKQHVLSKRRQKQGGYAFLYFRDQTAAEHVVEVVKGVGGMIDEVLYDIKVSCTNNGDDQEKPEGDEAEGGAADGASPSSKGEGLKKSFSRDAKSNLRSVSIDSGVALVTSSVSTALSTPSSSFYHPSTTSSSSTPAIFRTSSNMHSTSSYSLYPTLTSSSSSHHLSPNNPSATRHAKSSPGDSSKLRHSPLPQQAAQQSQSQLLNSPRHFVPASYSMPGTAAGHGDYPLSSTAATYPAYPSFSSQQPQQQQQSAPHLLYAPAPPSMQQASSEHLSPPPAIYYMQQLPQGGASSETSSNSSSSGGKAESPAVVYPVYYAQNAPPVPGDASPSSTARAGAAHPAAYPYYYYPVHQAHPHVSVPMAVQSPAGYYAHQAHVMPPSTSMAFYEPNEAGAAAPATRPPAHYAANNYSHSHSHSHGQSGPHAHRW